MVDLNRLVGFGRWTATAAAANGASQADHLTQEKHCLEYRNVYGQKVTVLVRLLNGMVLTVCFWLCCVVVLGVLYVFA